MPVTAPSLFDLSLKRITGEETSLATFRGEVLLIVNVASQCGLTPQYEGLESLFKTYAGQGFTILGFPANDFGGQEPGSNQEIASFCTSNFGASFPMFEKIAVTGPGAHELYRRLVAAQPVATPGDPGFRAQLDGFLSSRGEHTNPAPGILWNFEKFLVGRDGEVLARFAPDILPGDPRVTAAIRTALAAPKP